MKKLVFALCLLVSTLVSSEAAVPLTFDIGPLKLNMPFTNVSAVYLFDFVKDENLLGGETELASFKGITLSVGAVSSLEAEGLPFLGVDTLLPERYIADRIRFGAWVAYDFNEKDFRSGVKASVLAW